MAKEILRLVERIGYGGVAIRSESSKGKDYWLLRIQNNGQLWLENSVSREGTNFNVSNSKLLIG